MKCPGNPKDVLESKSSPAGETRTGQGPAPFGWCGPASAIALSAFTRVPRPSPKVN
jgi:hypothetical protein